MKRIIVKNFNPKIMQDSEKAADWLLSFFKNEGIFLKTPYISEEQEEKNICFCFMFSKELITIISNLRIKQIQKSWFCDFRNKAGRKYLCDCNPQKKVIKVYQEMKEIILVIKKKEPAVGTFLEKVNYIVVSNLLGDVL